LESACFVLVLAASSRSNSSFEFIELVKIGLSLLQKLPVRQPVTTVVSTLEHMLSRLDTLVNGCDRLVTASSRFGGIAAMSPGLYGLQHDPSNTALTMSSVNPNNIFEHSPNTLYQGGEELENLWSAIDWNMAFPSLDSDLLTAFQGT
jgi:hypothetical protein